MKFTGLIVVLVFLGCGIFSLSEAIREGFLMEQKTVEKTCRLQAEKFICESFRNCCKGKGFGDLNQWQMQCRCLLKLDYIAWCDSDEFMVDENSGDSRRLYYGKWIGFETDGEVYDRGEF